MVVALFSGMGLGYDGPSRDDHYFCVSETRRDGLAAQLVIGSKSRLELGIWRIWANVDLRFRFCHFLMIVLACLHKSLYAKIVYWSNGRWASAPDSSLVSPQTSCRT